MRRPPPGTTSTDTLCPYTTRLRCDELVGNREHRVEPDSAGDRQVTLDLLDLELVAADLRLDETAPDPTRAALQHQETVRPVLGVVGHVPEHHLGVARPASALRSEERREGNECGRSCSPRG